MEISLDKMRRKEQQSSQTRPSINSSFIEKENATIQKSEKLCIQWNVTPLLGDFGGIVGYCGIL